VAAEEEEEEAVEAEDREIVDVPTPR